jgi:uncharacterized protein YjbI with pentapeptide repeats
MEMSQNSSNQQWNGADFKGLDLSRKVFVGQNFRGCDFSLADLSGVQMIRCDLSGATLNHAILNESSFMLVNMHGAKIENASCYNAFWELCNLDDSSLSKSAFNDTMIKNCQCERAVCENVDFSDAKIIYTNCNSTRFNQSCFSWTITTGSSFVNANFTDVKDIRIPREIIVEILMRGVHGDIERAKLLGAVDILRKWCFPEWKEYLENYPDLMKVALNSFKLYPDSGLFEALVEGWSP